jgi:peptide/nickel transport system ATP-binding protein
MSTSAATLTEDAGRPTAEPVLVVDSLATTIHTERGALTAVDGVSLSLGAGETLGIVGESGSGKSVLGRTIMGLHTSGPTMTVTGSVHIVGKSVHEMSRSQLRTLWGGDVGMVFQDPMTALNPVKRIGTHLTESLRKHRGLDRRAARSRAEELLGLVGIPDPRRRLDQYPHELSGGMRQRVVIAMALANEPTLLIADEPTTALDVTVQRQILDLLQRLQGELGMAMVLISHNLGVVAGRADRVAVMYAGRFVENADTAMIFDRAHHPYTAALLRAIPELRRPPHERLAAIEGSPPDMASPPPGCRFEPRCGKRQDDCTRVPPALTTALEIGGPASHTFACFHPVGLGAR